LFGEEHYSFMHVPIRAVIITATDSRDVDRDISGSTLEGLLLEFGAESVERVIKTDNLIDLRETLHSLTERDDVNLILTTGGTGFGPRDNMPEATRAVIDREAPGLAEAIRRATAEKTPTAILSRGIAGTRGQTLIINLPGSPKAVGECFEVIRPVLQHCIDQVCGQTQH
jgi:molybdopterin adenylyltransferase